MFLSCYLVTNTMLYVLISSVGGNAVTNRPLEAEVIEGACTQQRQLSTMLQDSMSNMDRFSWHFCNLSTASKERYEQEVTTTGFKQDPYIIEGWCEIWFLFQKQVQWH